MEAIKQTKKVCVIFLSYLFLLFTCVSCSSDDSANEDSVLLKFK